MANANSPHGLRSVGQVFGVGQEVESFNKAVGLGTGFFIGDAVARAADGSMTITITPGATFYSGVNLTFGAASTATSHLIITDPFTIFEVQDDNDTDGIAAVDLGLNCNLNLTSVAGSTTTKLSGHQLDESSAATTSTLDVHLRKLFAIVGNAHGSNARIEVTFNNHRMLTQAAGV